MPRGIAVDLLIVRHCIGDLLLERGAAPAQALTTLLDEEGRLEANRTAGEATYNLQRHVAVLTAILAEARLLPLAPARA